MIPTTHALKRMDQRAIPPDFVELLGCFGVQFAAGKDVERVRPPRRETQRLRERLKDLLQGWDHLIDVYAVVSTEDVVITTAHLRARGRQRRAARLQPYR
jgi:hypothetical protein